MSTPADAQRGWHPDADTDLDLLRAELDSCVAEIARLLKLVTELQSILIDNTHALRTVMYGSSSAMACTPKEAWDKTLQELAVRLHGEP